MSDCGPSRDFKEIYFRARKVINDTTKMDNSFRSDPVGKIAKKQSEEVRFC